jgi:membrane dipeptidase
VIFCLGFIKNYNQNGDIEMINRRAFIGSLASTALIANLPKMASAQTVQSKIYVDSLCYDQAQVKDLTAERIESVIQGGLTTAVLDIGIYPREFANADKELASWEAKFKEPNTKLLSVLKAEDFEKARKDKLLGIILACQDASILGSSLSNWQTKLNSFYKYGLRVLQLTHNARTHWGDSFFEKRDGGVSLGGEDLIESMNKLGMIVDLSHCSSQTMLDAVQLSKKPCAVTHAGCKALAPTKRNKSDDEIRALGKNGGFFGVFNMTVWLTNAPTANIDTVINHIDHVAQLIGADKVGFGSDGGLDKLDAPKELTRMAFVQKGNAGGPSAEWEVKHVRVPELNAPNRLTALAEGLSKRNFTDAQIAGICGGNFVNFFKKVCG